MVVETLMLAGGTREGNRVRRRRAGEEDVEMVGDCQWLCFLETMFSYSSVMW